MQSSVGPDVFELENYTRDEIRTIVLNTTQRNISYEQFYRWLPFCLIPKPKELYTKRDLAKFLFIAKSLKRVRSLEFAKQQLIKDIQKNPQSYPTDSPKSGTEKTVTVNAVAC